MNDKENQIEEMAKGKAVLVIDMPTACDDCSFLNDNHDYPTCIVTDESEGYNFKTSEKRIRRCPLRVIPEDSVVLTREKLYELEENAYQVGITLGKKLGSKETAEKTWNNVIKLLRLFEVDKPYLLDTVYQYAKRDGIEIKE